MRTSLCFLLALSLLSGRGTTAQGLERVVPQAEGGSLPDLLAREFRRDEWKAALSVDDLERREQAFDSILQRARLDPLARAFLEELARAPDGGELAWTARLALRELGRARFGPRPTLIGPDPLVAGRMEQALQEWLEAGLPRARAQGLGVQLEQGQGYARIELSEGGSERRRFEGESLEAILRAHPELEALFGGSARARAGAATERSGAARTFALPLGPAQRSLPLVTDKLGVIVVPLAPDAARTLGLDPGLGLEVERVQADSYAALLGVVAGDILLELDGTPLRSADDIERGMRARRPESELALSWVDALAQRQKKTWKAPATAPR